LLPVLPTFAVVPLVKMHRTGQPPSVVPLDRKRTALANHFGCALDRKRTASGQPPRLSSDQSKPTPCGCASGQDASRWPTPFGCALDQKCTALANPPFGCALDRECTASSRRSDHTRTLPTISVVLANHFGCARRLLQLCWPAITAVPPPSFWTVAGPLRMMTGTYHLITPGPSIRVYAVAPLWRSAAIRALSYSRISNGPTISVSRAHRSSS
jgi:hypothetical protein